MGQLLTRPTIDRSIREQFEELGYLNPEAMLTQEECLQLVAALNSNFFARLTSSSPEPEWAKGLAPVSRVVYELATKRRVLDQVKALLGENVMLWGAQLIRKAPGEPHPWHTDMESWSCGGKIVSVWIGLTNISREASMRVVSRSHKFGETVQELRHANGIKRDNLDDEQIRAWARERDSKSDVVSFQMSDGDAFFCDGEIWHATSNNTHSQRKAILLQYATPDSVIRIPDDRFLDWPFRYLEARPPCLMVSGGDTAGINKMVSAPSIKPSKGGAGVLSGQGHTLEVPLVADHNTGWKRYPLFSGSLRSLDVLSAHASALTTDSVPHPPHRHLDEELLLVLDGKVEVELPDLGEGNQHRLLEPGQLVYYPVNFAHTLKAVSNEPANYLMIKWKDSSAKDQCQPTLPFGEFNYKFDCKSENIKENGFSFNILFEGPTLYLNKLHCHYSTLKVGGGYEPHVDQYSGVLVILEGEVEQGGKIYPPHSVLLFAAGEPHGLKNAGSIDAKYLVFEFHDRQTYVADSSEKRTLASKLTDPSCWKRLIRRIVTGDSH